MTVQAPETTPAPRCGYATNTGPCHRPAGHNQKTGHISKAALDAKRAKAAGKSLTPAEMEAKEAIRAAKAAEAIAAAKQAQEARVEKLREAAAALGFKLVPLTKSDLAAAKKAAAPEES